MKRWRRPLLVIALLLLGGAAMNMVIAWGTFISESAAYESDVSYGAGAKEPPNWHPDIPAEALQAAEDGEAQRFRRSDDPTVFVRAGRFGVIDVGTSWTTPNGERNLRVTWVCGWPCKALRAHLLMRTPPGGQQVKDSDASYGGLRTPWRHGALKTSDGQLPIQPLFPGFAINTLLYAAILALPLSVFPIRRRLRARRGRCLKCGYDRAGLGGADGDVPCPECGAAR